MCLSKKTVLFVILLYCCRLLYCFLGYLKNYNWLDNADESYIYLLGLKYYATGVLPRWGPDIACTSTCMIGGLQGFLVGFPLFVCAHPFAPYALLFIIQTLALLYLSRYVTQLFPQVNAWIIYFAVALAPVTLHTGLKIINPAYVLVFSIPFMLSFIELLNVFKDKKFIAFRWRFFWMSLGTGCVFQLHASWVVFAFFGITAVLFFLWKRNNTKADYFTLIGFSVFGFLVGFSLALPVIYHYGPEVFFGQSRNLNFSMSHILDGGRVLFYFVTLSGYEMNLFSGVYCWDRLWDQYSKFGAVLFLILQIGGLLIFGTQLVLFLSVRGRAYAGNYKPFLALSGFVILSISAFYMFSVVRPDPHAIICLFPLSVIYLIFCLNYFLRAGFVNKKGILGFFILVSLYYVLITSVDRVLPDLGYRGNACKAIKTKSMGLFQHARFNFMKE
jgi:hypothetical protein